MVQSAELSLLLSLKKKKKPVIIKVSCGIGDNDGFPALDAASDNYKEPDDLKWGFKITGGAEFHMPITVFHVTNFGLASEAGICLGDIIVEINGIDVTNSTLSHAHELINEAYDKLSLVARTMDYGKTEKHHDHKENEDETEEKAIEEKSVMLRRRMPPKMPDPPKEFRPTPLMGTKVWHPIMCELPRINPDEIRPGDELPHKRIIRNIRRFFTETAKDDPELRQKYMEDICLALPK